MYLEVAQVGMLGKQSEEVEVCHLIFEMLGYKSFRHYILLTHVLDRYSREVTCMSSRRG